jgi:NitT/TauT family transport system substrate-binding protein
MNKKHILLLSLCMVFVVTMTSAVMAQDEKLHLKIGYSTWVGYGPLFIAQEKGYFTDAGLEVELVKVEDPKDRFVALAGAQLDGLVTTLDTMSQYWNAETPYRAILGLDESSGGDGIVVNSGIASVEDLKGKKIGVNVGSVSQFFLEYVMKEHNMTDADVQLVKMKQGDVPAALASNQIDAGVTWEPHLSKSVDNGATLLVSSKETPGLIVDIMVMRDNVLTDNPTVGTALINAWYKAVDYENANPDDGAALMQQGLGGFYEKPDDIKADLAGVTLFDEARNKEFFNGTNKGSATATLQFAIDFYTSLNIITTPVDTAKLIDSSYVGPMDEATPEATPAS